MLALRRGSGLTTVKSRRSGPSIFHGKPTTGVHVRRERGPYRYRRLQRLEGASNDSYRPARKPRGAVACMNCGAVFRRGRWSWDRVPAGAARVRCPACWRADEGMPGGVLTLKGRYLGRHLPEIMGLIAHCEAKEESTHPLERIIGRRSGASATVIQTTSAHLARRLGRALRRAFKGELSQRYGSDGVLRADWRRDA
jgi:hypothetical protein